uniref:acyl-coenzyme A thioesterase THEM4-like n=1 Tax=Euleptes europaea TaxID=460621 RepID=UPI0025419612|nr:acyl-coenzyme A thioesterase THEM4-like [Euleptes europaea]
MQPMLRSASQMAAELARLAAPRCGPQAPACHRALLGSTHTPVSTATARFCQSQRAKDYALPNASWSQEMVTQFNKYMEMSKDGTWKRLPSYRNILEHLPERMRPEHKKMMNRDTRIFLRNVDEEGKGFEYVMFLNPKEKRMVCLFQPGSYLEGPPGFTHGGSIATILDCTLGGSGTFFAGKVMTANLNVNYKNPVPLGSVVLVESKIDRVEGKKVFISGQVRSIDGETLYAEATGLFIQIVSQKISQQPESSK